MHQKEHPEYQYLNLVRRILDEGEYKDNRTGVGTYAIFGTQMRFNLREGFPLLTTKFTHFPSIAHELLWFISGNTNIKYLQDNGVRIWNEWANENGDLGPVYGAQWRNFDGSGIDQLQNIIDKLRTNPNDRRLICSAWNPKVLPVDEDSFSVNVANGKCALPPCHAFYQFFHINGKLSLQMYQRSVDSFLGLPFNIASYALLLQMVAHVTGLEAHELIWTGGDTHIYENHIEQINEQLTRKPHHFPLVALNPDCKEIDDFKFDDIQLINYHSHPKLTGKVAV